MDKKLQSTLPCFLSKPPVRDRMIALLVAVKLNGNRNVSGTLRGFDQFLNIVLDNTVEEVSATERNNVGMVVRDAVPLMPVAILAANSHRPFSVNHCTGRALHMRTRTHLYSTVHAPSHASDPAVVDVGHSWEQHRDDGVPRACSAELVNAAGKIPARNTGLRHLMPAQEKRAGRTGTLAARRAILCCHGCRADVRTAEQLRWC